MSDIPAIKCLSELYVSADNGRKKLQAEKERLLWIINQIVNSLPKRRDWLDPDIEKEAKLAIKEYTK